MIDLANVNTEDDAPSSHVPPDAASRSMRQVAPAPIAATLQQDPTELRTSALRIARAGPERIM